MRKLILKNLKGKVIIPLFLLSGIIYAVMLTITIPKVMAFAGGMKILDMLPTGYNAVYAETLLKNLGEAGRNVYLFNQIPLDMIFPLLYGISLCLILAFFIKKFEKADGYFFFICLLPLFAGLFDYCENIGIIIMLKCYPHHLNFLAGITNVFSVLKSLFTSISYIILIIFLIVLGLRKAFIKDKLHS